MPTFKVNVKWGKKKLEKLELDTSEAPAVFKSQLFSLTGVAPERQKLMIGGIIVGDENWNNTKPKVKANATFMLMGSADSLPQAPKEKTKFIEDMTESEAAAALSMPTGIENFGNTCYVNATVQCLRAVPELRKALIRYNVSDELDKDTSGSPETMTRDLKMLYEIMDKGQDVHLSSMMFLRTLHTAVPEFADKDEKTGLYQQQDAHECWSAVLTHLSQTLTMPGTEEAAVNQFTFMKKYFGVEVETSYKCEESPDEAVTTETENSYQVSCFISQEVKYMHTALRKGLEGTVEKASPSLGRDAVYKKTSRIKRLPAYLTVQFVRFFVGKAPDSDEMVPKKILKDVKYTMKVDMYEFCTPHLQEKLIPMRSKFKEVEETMMARKAKMIAEGTVLGPKQAHASQAEKEDVDYEPYEFEDDPGSNSSGYYDLVAVLTHKGRSSSSGHYVGWVLLKDNEWVKLDDEKVTVVPEDHILKLSGGGDWHVAYILLYGPRRLEILGEDTSTATGEDAVPMETESSSADK